MPNPRKPARLWLRKRTDGSPAKWVILDGGDQFPTGCSAFEIEKAHDALQSHLAERHKPDTKQRSIYRISCSDVLNMFVDTIPANSPSRATRLYHVMALEEFWGDLKMSDITRTNCRAYVEFRPVKASTARQELKTLQAAVNSWHKESPLESVPQVTLPPPAPPKERVLTRDEAAALLWACRAVRRNGRVEGYHVSRVVRLGLATGTRSKAMLELAWMAQVKGGWIDLDNGILFRRGWRDRETSKRRAPVALPPKALAMCRRWKAMDDRDGINSVIHYRKAPVAKLRNSWAAVAKASGLHDVTPHTLKHTAVSWMLMNGVKLSEVSMLTGTDMVTLERVYAHCVAIADAKKKA